MSRVVARANVKDMALLALVARQHHPELLEAKVNIAFVLVHPKYDAQGIPQGPALTRHGHPVAGRIRLAKPADRLIGKYDALLEVDAFRWEKALQAPSREALLDHKLSHLVLVRDESGEIETHADGRPKLRLRPDDWAVTGFAAVIDRHREAALEYQALELVCRGCQLTFEQLPLTVRAAGNG
ncbi:MAG TPA: putative metallopeptidase [Phycisphaerae bacterium]|nr:putative metallopeptidase [Phycisphaerae bacterium]